MLCEHLASVEQALLDWEANETFRGQAWSQHCREWVYFDCVLDLAAIRNLFDLAACVSDHEHKGTHDGQELGLVCNQCRDGLMGMHPDYKPAAARVFPDTGSTQPGQFLE